MKDDVLFITHNIWLVKPFLTSLLMYLISFPTCRQLHNTVISTLLLISCVFKKLYDMALYVQQTCCETKKILYVFKPVQTFMFKNFQCEQRQKTATSRWLELRLKGTIWADVERHCGGNVTEMVKISKKGSKRGQSKGWICSSADCKTWNQHRSWTADADSLSSSKTGLFFFTV